MKINVHYRKNFNAAQVVKHSVAMDMLELVTGSVEFHDRLLTTKLVGGSGKVLTLEAKEALYEQIQGGAEVLEPELDHEIDLYLELYEKNNKVVGYTSKNILTIFSNNKFFKIFNYAEIAGNVFHEWLHKMGFGHRDASDHDSIPYALGYLVRSMVQAIIDSNVKYTPINQVPYVEPAPEIDPQPVYRYDTVCYRYWIFFKKCKSVKVLVNGN